MALTLSPPAGSCAGLADYHVHSNHSADSPTAMPVYVERAAELGLAELGFAEHIDLDPRDWGYGHFHADRYLADLAEARRAAGERLIVRTGLELTYQPQYEGDLRRLADALRLDYRYGSVHFVDGTQGGPNIVEPEQAKAYFAAHGEQEAYAPYWAELRAAVASGIFDLIGHLDVVKRYALPYYGPFRPESHAEAIRDILRLAVERGVGLEINASGWRQPCAEPYPSATILRWYRELGGEILVLGSDTHYIEQLGYGMPEAAELARAAGFRALARLERRRVSWVDL